MSPMIIILVLIVPVALALFILWMERLEAVVLQQPPVPSTVDTYLEPEPDTNADHLSTPE